jgi:hypothetical protein
MFATYGSTSVSSALSSTLGALPPAPLPNDDSGALVIGGVSAKCADRVSPGIDVFAVPVCSLVPLTLVSRASLAMSAARSPHGTSKVLEGVVSRLGTASASFADASDDSAAVTGIDRSVLASRGASTTELSRVLERLVASGTTGPDAASATASPKAFAARSEICFNNAPASAAAVGAPPPAAATSLTDP